MIDRPFFSFEKENQDTNRSGGSILQVLNHVAGELLALTCLIMGLS